MNASPSFSPLDKVSSRATPVADDAPWWRYAMVWVVIAGPLAVLVAGFVTLAIALTHVDPLVTDNAAASKRTPGGPATPAQVARNHAATPQK
jgi:uncharacterized protein